MSSVAEDFNTWQWRGGKSCKTYSGFKLQLENDAKVTKAPVEVFRFWAVKQVRAAKTKGGRKKKQTYLEVKTLEQLTDSARSHIAL